jgi:hypothetical protein
MPVPLTERACRFCGHEESIPAPAQLRAELRHRQLIRWLAVGAIIWALLALAYVLTAHPR